MGPARHLDSKGKGTNIFESYYERCTELSAYNYPTFATLNPTFFKEVLLPLNR